MSSIPNIARLSKAIRADQVMVKFRTTIIVASQLALFVMTYHLSFLLRFDFKTDEITRFPFLETLLLILVVKLLIFYRFGLFHGWWRYVGVSDLLDIAKASFISYVTIYLGIYLYTGMLGYPRSVLGIDLCLTILAVGGTRLLVRSYTENVKSAAVRGKVIIVGGGEAGRSLIGELRRNPNLGCNPVAIVDDDSTKKGIKIEGVTVEGNVDDLPRLIERCDARKVFIAIPSATSKQMQRIIQRCQECKVDFRTLPALGDLINGSISFQQLRKPRIEDVLGRETVELDLTSIRQKVLDKVVLVTGAGGSIGSELVRQLARLQAGHLVLFERSENDLYKITLELSTSFPQLSFSPYIGDILDVDRLHQVITRHRPQSIFHAAAYKHVPMMEANCLQAITNNVFGTYNVALVAAQCNVSDFVMISSDKAVNPTNIMGVTKRIAELVVLSLHSHSTRFVAVRFGNVLGSNGSVLPLFQEQIATGRPVTVTHSEAQRYFMTIPEAVQLVLQASTMGQGGEIFVLDMGKPVKIADLATNLIRLSGFEPNREVQIVYTGLRPGEKLFEEICLAVEGIESTTHRKIFVIKGTPTPFEQISAWVDQLGVLVDAKNMHAVISKLKEIVPEYCPSKEVLSLCDFDRHDKALLYKQARVQLRAMA